jgi:hypothetical protein
LPHQGRAGLVREAGRLTAKGEYLQYLDSDDLLLPEKFATMVRALEENPQCDVAYCYTRRYRRGDPPIDVPTELTGETFQAMLPAFLGRRFWHTSTPLYRKRVCDEAGPWSDLLFWEDIEYDIRVATRDPRLYHCKEFLTDFRDHDMCRICSIDDYRDPFHMSDAARAAALIYQHVKKCGITNDDENLRFFIDDVRVISDRCEKLGLDQEARRCADIVQDATGADGRDGVRDLTIRATFAPQNNALRALAGQTLYLPVRVVNESSVSFRRGEFAFELSYHVLSVDGAMLQFDNPKTLFDRPLRPGEERVVDLLIRAPSEVGLYYLEIDALWGALTWLKSRGNPTATVKLFVGENIREKQWWLQVSEGNVATAMFPAEHPETVRIAIEKAETTIPWHIQLNRDRLSVLSKQRYEVELQGRADKPRRMAVAVSRAHPPWDNLGLYREIELASTWKSYQMDFVATADDDNARVHFDLGGSDVSVELKGVSLYSPADGRAVEPFPMTHLGRLQMDIGVKPLSQVRGTDRGLALHRYYLRQFLTEFAADFHGSCVEFQGSQNLPLLGERPLRASDILDIDSSRLLVRPIADLTKPDTLPSSQFHCILCCHVLQLIVEIGEAIAEMYRSLAPGGVLLVAEPHVSMCGSMDREIWRFTPEGLKTLLSRAFGVDHVTVRTYGNSLTAAGELRGLVAQEFAKAELDEHDDRFAVEVCARAVKAI